MQERKSKIRQLQQRLLLAELVDYHAGGVRLTLQGVPMEPKELAETVVRNEGVYIGRKVYTEEGRLCAICFGLPAAEDL